MKISVVIPAYNEGDKIKIFLSHLKKVKLPIIIVDDGSSDSTSFILNSYVKKKFIYIRHKINLGKGAALKTGCETAFRLGADAVIIMDSDGQHKVSDIPKFVKAINSSNYDIVFGSRNLTFGVPLVRFLGNKLASLLVSFLFGLYISDLICGFRAFSKKAYSKINWQSTGYGVETEMVINTAKYKLRHCEVPVETIYYDKFKGVTILDAVNIFFDLLFWRLKA